MTARHGAALIVLLCGLFFGGAGYLNGDAAAYAAQGWAGDVWSRPVHVLWCALATCLAPLAGDALPRALDGVTSLCGAWLVVGSGSRGGRALLAAAFVLPWSAFAEVDLLWMALILGATRVTPRGLAGPLAALAVATSPLALLATPWACRERGDLAPLVGAVLAVMLLSVGSGGDWWVGHRGVLLSEWMPGRTLQAWGASAVWAPVLAAVWSGERKALWLLPLLLAPPDVPAWVLLAVVASARIDRPDVRGPMLALGAVACLVGLGSLTRRAAEVRLEDDLLHGIASGHRDGQGYAGPWSWGTRLSVVATGRVDGLPFRPDRPLADGRWPAPEVSAVGLLPPGRPPSDPMVLVRVDAHGVHWVEPWWEGTR